jgi:hypothetical protein
MTRNRSVLLRSTRSGSQKKSWLVDLKSGAGSLAEVDAAKPPAADCIIAMEVWSFGLAGGAWFKQRCRSQDGKLVELMTGKLNPQTAFMKGARGRRTGCTRKLTGVAAATAARPLTGHLKLKGNMMLAQKLELLMKQRSAL